MTIPFLIDGLAAVTNSLLGIFVLVRAPRGQSQRAFAWLTFSLSLWIVSVMLIQRAVEMPTARAELEVAFASSLIMAACMVWFAAGFPASGARTGKKGVRVFVAAGAALALLAPLGAYDRGVTRSIDSVWAPIRGPLSPVGSLYLVLAAGFFIYCIGSGWKKSRGLERAQLHYLLLGSVLALGGGITANLVLPLFFHSLRYESIGPAASLLFVLASGYSIARFRLLDVSQVILKGLAFGLAIAGMAAAFIAAVVLTDSIATSALGFHAVGAQAAVAMILAMLFQPLYQALRKLLAVFFFRRTYDYAKTLRAVSRGMTSVLDLEQLRAHVSSSVMENMQVEWASLSIARRHTWDPGEEPIERQTARDGAPDLDLDPLFRGPHRTTVAQTFSPSLVWLMMHGQIVLREEAAQDEHNSPAQRIAAQMERLGADVAAPLLFKDELLGILLVGPKRSGAIFTDEDAVLLSTLANQAAIALRNAQLYHEVRSSQQYTHAILERLDSAVITVDSDAEPIVVNEAAQRLLPRINGQVTLPPFLRSVVHAVFRSGQEQSDLEFDLLGPSETATPVIATVCPFLAESGQVESALIVIRDISVIRRLEHERLNVQRLSSVSRVAATLAHEIRNPLAAIKTFCQLLPEKYLDNEFRESFADIALDEVNRIDSLVGTLLSVDKPAIGQMEAIRVQDAIYSTLKLIKPLALERSVEIQFDGDDSVPKIWGDSGQLRQLFLNLLLNAQEAAVPRSCVNVRLFFERDTGIVAEVSNHGESIQPEHLPRLFEPFFTTKERGTGLGLTVCKQVAEYHGGTISAMCVDGLTTFKVVLPPAAGITPDPVT